MNLESLSADTVSVCVCFGERGGRQRSGEVDPNGERPDMTQKIVQCTVHNASW